MDDDFCEEDLFGVQMHGVPQTTYNTFYVQNVRGNTNIEMGKFQLITCAPHTHALCELDPQSNIQQRCGLSSYKAHSNVACAVAREVATWPVQL